MRAACALIHLDAITRNLARVRARVGNAKIMAVVKADGYGHGLERVVRQLTGADAFGVASLDDAERIRALGMRHRIVLLSGIDEARDLRIVRELSLDMVIHDPHQLALLAAEANAEAEPALPLWIKFDTGMHRLGFPHHDAPHWLQRLRALPQARGEIVVMSHFAASDECAQRTQQQMQRFDAMTALLAGDYDHSLSNSAACLRFPRSHRSWVRPGGILYGLSTVPQQSGADLGFEAAMSLKSKLIAIKNVAAGAEIGYGGSYQANAPMRIGIAAMGYGDGYPRHAPSGTAVLVDGKRCATVGRVSMDLMAIDLAHAGDVGVGAEVLFWGPELSAEEIAQQAGSISYELTCGVTRRVRFLESS
jgi:alanine racemase